MPRRLEEENQTTNVLLKIISIVFLLAMAICFGVMPFFIKKCRRTKFLGLANAFSGGLFLGIGLFHILPESSELLEEIEIPIPYFMAFLSYALILFVEKIAFNSHKLMHGGEGHSHSHEHEEENEKVKEKETEHLSQQDVPLVRDSKPETENLLKDYQQPLPDDPLEEKKDQGENEKQHLEEMKEKGEGHEHKHEHEHDHEHNEHQSSGTGFTPYILLLALGFHGLFEGMALGIQSKIEGTLFLLLAIAAHKWAASLTLGISFVKAGVTKNRLITMVTIFALIGPVGIAFGLILSSAANDVVEGIFLSMSTGTFIYIACSEVIVEEFASQENKYMKFFMFMLGGVFTAGLALMELIEHEGGEHSG